MVPTSTLYHRAKIYLAQGRLEQALKDLDEVLRLQPRLVIAYLSRALVKDRTGHYMEASADCAQAVRLDESLAAAHFVRGLVQAHQGEYQTAIGALTRAIQLDERFPLAYFERSGAWILQKDYNRALADCNQLILLEPTNAQAYAQRSIVHHFQGTIEAALADYAQALRIDPRWALASLHQGVAEAARSQTTQRIADYIDGFLSGPPSAEFPIVLPDREVRRPDPVPTAPSHPPASSPAPLEPRKRQPPRKPPGETMIAAAVAETQVEMPISAAPEVVEHEIEEVPTESAETGSSAESAPVAAESGAGREHLHQEPRYVPSAAASATTLLRTTSERKRVKDPVKKKAVAIQETGLGQKWKRPMPLAAASVCGLLALYLCFPKNLHGDANHLTVFPAQGVVSYLGKPIPSATIFLHPVGTKDPDFPSPRATVKSDGSFVLGTYGEADGAPVGEYKVTVQWFKKTDKKEAEGGALPRNQLPAKYARAETSGLSLRIQEGDNKVPPFQLK